MDTGQVDQIRRKNTHLNWLICFLLAASTFAVYWQVRTHDFLRYDDDLFVSENPYIRNGLTWHSLRWAFTADLLTDSKNADYWSPMTILSRILDIQFLGLKPAGHHLMNIVYHVLSTVVLFLVFRRMTGSRWRSAFVAALFALHPLHVESVAWVTERKDTLSGLFWMLTLWAYVRYAEQPKPTRYLLSLGLYSLGLMSKPMVVTLPFVLLLLDYWPLARTRWAEPAAGARAKASFSRLLWEKLPFLALAIATSVVAYWAQEKGGAVSSLEKLPLDVRVPNAMVSYVRYLGKAFWPSRLAAFYPYEIWPLSMVLLAGAALLGVSGVVIWRARREPWLATGWFWYLGTLVPAIGFVQAGGQSMADRYTYIPLVGLFMMVAWAVPCAAPDQRVRKVVTAAAAATLLGACAVLCQVQVRYWKNTETLFRHAVEVTTNNSLAHCNFGVELGRAGRVGEAIGQLEEAVRIQPDYAEAHNSLGRSLMLVGKLNEAIGHLEQALRIQPDLAEAHYNLGGALGRAGRMQEAIEHYEQALRIKPDWAVAHYDLGVALGQADRMQEAIGHYEQALRFKPDHAQAHNNLGVILLQQGKVQEAIGHWEEALRIKPNYVKAHYDLGVALERAGNVREAIAHYEEAVRLEPDLTNAQSRLTELRVIP